MQRTRRFRRRSGHGARDQRQFGAPLDCSAATSDATPKLKGPLLPVVIEAPTSGQGRADGQAQLATRRHRSGAGSIEIELSGARIHLRGEIDATALTTVIDILPRR